MHHFRGLVRKASRDALRTLEGRGAKAPADAASCVCNAQLHDVDGRREVVALLRTDVLLRMLKTMSPPDALRALEAVSTLLTYPKAPLSSPSSCIVSSPLNAGAERSVSVLYVKDAVREACAEVHQRQQRFLAKLRGRYISTDPVAVEATLKSWLAMPMTDFDEVVVAEYNGMVESLASVEHSAASAVALAINASLPCLTSGASTALAHLVNLQTSSAVHAFLESFAAKDEAAPSAAETTATQLAVRLRREMAAQCEHRGAVPPVLLHAQHAAIRGGGDDGNAELGERLREVLRFSVDPGIVFPAEPGALQAWATQFFSPDMLPVERAQVLMAYVRRHRLQPRRVSMDALSVWTLTDLERPWLTLALEACERNAPTVPHGPYATTAYHLALKDVRRNCIENRLLHTYAAALARGDVSALDETFAAFLEECGESHAPSGVERPSRFVFTLPPVPPGVPLLRALRDLAPRSSYWCTILDHFATKSVRACTAPMGEIKVEVQLPESHECVEALTTGAVPLPSPFPVLYEDAHLVIIDKPAGLATSRHGLSCTQLGYPTTDVISVWRGMSPSRTAEDDLFRQGQVHRLDTDTSGCLLLAKTNVAADSLRHQMGTSAAFSHHSKVYHALCLVLEPSLDAVRLQDDITDAVDPKVRTRYRVIRFFPQHRAAWVECRIQQGKRHQIRRHLASRGLPILADVEHGGAACSQSMMSRVALHAHSLSFLHPVTAEPIVAVAPLPRDFRECLAALQTLKSKTSSRRTSSPLLRQL